MNVNPVGNYSSTKTGKLVRVGMFAALLSVLSQLSIPMPSGVPVTLQTFAVALTAYVLGWRLAGAAMAVYLLLGAVGLPVFANFKGGLAAFAGPTGGFLWGFLMMAMILGFAAAQRSRGRLVTLSAAGLAVCYLSGIVHFMLLMHMGFVQAAMVMAVPYMAKDMVSVLLAYMLAAVVRRAMAAAERAA